MGNGSPAVSGWVPPERGPGAAAVKTGPRRGRERGGGSASPGGGPDLRSAALRVPRSTLILSWFVTEGWRLPRGNNRFSCGSPRVPVGCAWAACQSRSSPHSVHAGHGHGPSMTFLHGVIPVPWRHAHVPDGITGSLEEPGSRQSPLPGGCIW